LITEPHFKHFDSLILVAGISGAGKSTAMHLLSDCGYAVVDNLPVPLLRHFLDFSNTATVRYRKTALLIDVDSEDSQRALQAVLGERSQRPSNVQLIFLDAETKAVVRRYSETRRPHPGFDPITDSSLEDAVQRERNRLQTIKETADFIVDTSSYNVHVLKRELRQFLLTLGTVSTQSMRVNFVSFGFKRGLPLDCDLVVDVRFLRNPHFVDALREHTGQEQAVKDYVFESQDAAEFVKRYTDLLAFLLPRYQFEGKAYVNIGIGCTGGKHRSVAIAEALCQAMDQDKYLLSIKHRDI
jgi:UPF0042 nucleotide-binding protein